MTLPAAIGQRALARWLAGPVNGPSWRVCRHVPDARHRGVAAVVGTRGPRGRPPGPDVFAFDAERVQRVLQEAHGTGRAQCLCGGTSGNEERLLAIRRLEDTFYLARYPNSQDQHRPDCRWAITEDRDRRGDDRGDREELRFALPIGRSMRAAETGEADDGLDRHRRVSSGARARRTTLLGLFLWLWDEAELTWWHRGFASRRTDGGAIARVRAAASKALWGGAPVADGMIVAPAGP